MPSLELINWPALGANSLWILGLALMVTWLGWRVSASKEASQNAAVPEWMLTAGEILFCAGLVFTSTRTLERIVWLALTGLGLVSAGISLYRQVKADNLSRK